MITVKQKTGVLAGALLTIAVVSMPAEAATTYDTNFQVFDPTNSIELFNIQGTVTYDGPALTSTFQDFSLADANNSAILKYNWNVNSFVGFVGNFTETNSFWNAIQFPPISACPIPFEISADRFVLKPLATGQIVELFTNDNQNGFTIQGPTTGGGVNYSYILGEAQPIPTPALLPGLLGFGATILRRKKQQAEATV
jgi:hypothetical protein